MTIWFVICGVLLIGMALAGTVVRRLPVTTSLLYLGAGILLGPLGMGLVSIDPASSSRLLERLTEIAILVSLFAAGLKLRAPVFHRDWRLPLQLATSGMLMTIALVALAGVYGLGLSPGAAVLLGAILAPTDPVLASEVQVESASDRDRVRFALTGEAGLNDGAAFPFVMLGLAMLGLHETSSYGWRWITMDVVWAVGAGLGVGSALGTIVGHLVLFLRRERKEAVGLDDLLALGLIALAYGIALAIQSSGFLAVFAAGLALRRIERRASKAGADGGTAHAPNLKTVAALGAADEIATAPETAPAYMAAAALGFTEQLERIAEFTVVLLIGGMLASVAWSYDSLWFVPLLLLVIRPVSVWLGAPMRRSPKLERRMVAWFGIRGIGSVYYLAYAIQHGLPTELSERLASITLASVAVSIVVHGISGTPLMRRYVRATKGPTGGQPRDPANAGPSVDAGPFA